MASRFLTLIINSRYQNKTVSLQLDFNYSAEGSGSWHYYDTISPIVKIAEIGDKEFFYEDERLLIVPGIMSFTLVDPRRWLTDLIIEGKPWGTNPITPLNIPLRNKKIYARYYVSDVLTFEGFVSFDPAEAKLKDRELRFNIAPRTEILKERTINQLGTLGNRTIKQFLLACLQTVYPALLESDIQVYNNWKFLGDHPEACNTSTVEFDWDAIYLDCPSMFAATETLYQALINLSFTFFSQLFIDGKKVIFKKMDMKLPDNELVYLENNKNLRDIFTEYKNELHDAVKITFYQSGIAGGVGSRTVGDADGYVFERKIIWSVIREGFTNCSGTLIQWQVINLLGLSGGTYYYIRFLKNVDEEIYRFFPLQLAYSWYYFKIEQGAVYNLQVLINAVDLFKSFRHKFGNVVSFYSPVAMTTNTLSGVSEVKCLKTNEEIEYDLLEGPELIGGLYTIDGFRLHDSTGAVLFAKQEES